MNDYEKLNKFISDDENYIMQCSWENVPDLDSPQLCLWISYVSLEDFVNQPADGMLYDLNRNEAVILQFIDDPKWVNDFACAQVIRYLKKELDDFKKSCTI